MKVLKQYALLYRQDAEEFPGQGPLHFGVHNSRSLPSKTVLDNRHLRQPKPFHERQALINFALAERSQIMRLPLR